MAVTTRIPREGQLPDSRSSQSYLVVGVLDVPSGGGEWEEAEVGVDGKEPYW